MRKTLIATFLLALALPVALAQGPNGSGSYYRNANGKSGAALKTALGTIISTNAKDVGYDGLKTAYQKTDKRADGKVRDWYSNITNYTWDDFGKNTKEGAGWNREHLVPQSWFGSGTPKSDVVQVVPTDCWVNAMRGNLVLAEVASVVDTKKDQSANGYSKRGPCKTDGYSGKVFEPNNEVKGDIARIYFYMVTRYEDLATGWGNSVFSSKAYPGFEQWYLDMLMRWSALDPIDDIEVARNNAVYGVQKNRNPFVDYPGLENYVWGDKKATPFSYDHYDSGEVIIVERVEQPVFTPAGGTYADSVVVTITTGTDNATIYYTTNGTEPSASSTRYIGPITLKSNTTLKAVAVKDGMDTSYQTTANYVIKASGGAVTPVEGVIALNNQLFGTSFGGALGTAVGTFTGTVNGITIVYDKGSSGSNMFINDEQLRLYPGNTLTISCAEGTLATVEFTVVNNKGNHTLVADTGFVSGFTWSGNAERVVFNVSGSTGHVQLSQVKVGTSSLNPTIEGDVNGDGIVDSRDLAKMLQDIWNNTHSGQGGEQSDLNNDGRVDVGDIIKTIIQMTTNNKDAE